MAFSFRHCGIALVTIAVFISGCATDTNQQRVERNVEFTGFYNEISGALSDGSAVSGVAWFTGNIPRGDFCLKTEETVCSGRYSASPARRISGDFVCANGMTGSYKTERIPAGDFIVPVKATGTVSDGRTANVVFSKLKKGSGTVACFTAAKG